MHPLVSLAKNTVEKYIKEGKVIEPPEIKGFKKGGVFVTIKKNGNLRACIGTSESTKKNIIEEVIQNSIAASTEDYRFGKIKEEELDSLSYEVSLLEKPELVSDLSSLDPKKYGIIIETKNYPFKKALLLPDLDEIDTKEKQISVALQKGSIGPQEEISIYRFKVKKYE